jgi:hypothetical protein
MAQILVEISGAERPGDGRNQAIAGTDEGTRVIRTASSGIRPPVSRGLLTLVTGLFFLSGSAGLVYQVLSMRSLGLFFGSDMYGVSIILSTFMGGLALGSLLGGRLAEHTDRPLLWYGVAELGIGRFALPFSSIPASFDPRG